MRGVKTEIIETIRAPDAPMIYANPLTRLEIRGLCIARSTLWRGW